MAQYVNYLRYGITVLNTEMGGISFQKAENISEINESGLTNTCRILIGLFDRVGYVSVDVYWIRFQFKSDNSGTGIMQYRIIYGNSMGEWIQL